MFQTNWAVSSSTSQSQEREERHVLLILHIFPKSFADSYIVIALTDMPNYLHISASVSLENKLKGIVFDCLVILFSCTPNSLLRVSLYVLLSAQTTSFFSEEIWYSVAHLSKYHAERKIPWRNYHILNGECVCVKEYRS